MSLGSQINFRQLLDRHGQIHIPIIQRDYAQGRPEEKEVREEFLNALKGALEKSASDPTLPLNLDFIYGSVEGNEETRFLPLDGQQRLTTLFLLHWYLAWKDNQWATFEKLFQQDDGRARFAYRVRQSSNEFFDQLVSFHPSDNPEGVPKLVQLITDQPWLFRSWRLDPTIQAVLHMLEAIHQRFVSSTGLFLRLIDEHLPAITFQLLDLDNFGLSDDLYIKMNARGKPLTAFETFKARYEQDLKGQLEGHEFYIGEHSFCVSEYFARKMDTTWADLFWKLRDKKSALYDEAIMNVFRAVALITLTPDDAKYPTDIDKLRNRIVVPSYSDFHSHGWLREQFSLTVINLLDSWSADSRDFSKVLHNNRCFDEATLINKVCSKAADLSYTEIVQFAAYSGFIVKHQDSIESNAFKEWMRIIYNLSVNTRYNRPSDLGRSIRGLSGLLDESRDILGHFVNNEKPVAGFNEKQIAEEKLKAELILAHEGWKALIGHAEEHGYFRGQIEFLLNFCGAIDARVKSEPNLWAVTDHASLQESFLRFLQLAEEMFSERGLKDNREHRWQRALLCIGDYLLPSGRNYSFLEDSTTDEASWKRFLRGAGKNTPNNRQFLKQLWERLSLEEDLDIQLDRIINSSDKLEPWREAIVHCPKAIDYCKRNSIRWRDENTIYLLYRSQMNGYHAELFTYCLYQRLKNQNNYFKVFKLSYKRVKDTNSEPHIKLSCKLQDKDVTFTVEHQGGKYWIEIIKTDCRKIINLEDVLSIIGFSENGDYFQIRWNRSDIEAQLKGLDETLLSEFDLT